MPQSEIRRPQKRTAKLRFNIVDLVLIIAVLACIAGVYLRFHFSEEFGVNHVQNEYAVSFEVKNIRYTSVDAFPTGDNVYLQSSRKLLGTIIGIDSTSPSQMIYTDYSGNVKQIYYPEDSRIDLTGRIAARGTLTERGFMLDGNTYLAPGASYLVLTPHINVTLTITDIQPMPETK